MKNSIIAAVLSLLTLLLISEFDFFNSLLWMPNFIWILPLYLLFRVSVYYFKMVFTGKLSVSLKIGVIVLNVSLGILLLYLGFQLWKINSGNILSSQVKPFEITLKNTWFWIVFQSYLILFFFSAFKQLVTIDQK